jgi:hypothetical protein
MRKLAVTLLRRVDAYLFGNRIPVSHFGGSDGRGNYGWPLAHRDAFHAHNRWLDGTASKCRKLAWRLEHGA